jgi:putative acetyltransferase
MALELSGQMKGTTMETLSEVKMSAAEVEIRPMQLGEDGTPFRVLNEEWISRYFKLEERDIETLSNPEKILRDGGQIYFAWVAGEVVGVVALILITDDGVYELSKMAVSPAMRGRGIGRKILVYAIKQARNSHGWALPVRRLFLGSSKRLVDAVHLYESLGFEHISPELLPWVGYARADVFMELPL